MPSLYIMENIITNIHALRSSYAECEEAEKARFLKETWEHPNAMEFENAISGNLAGEIVAILDQNKKNPSQWYMAAAMHLKQYNEKDFHKDIQQLDIRDGYKKNIVFWNDLCSNTTWTDEKCRNFLGLLLICIQLKEPDEELALSEKELFQSLFYQAGSKAVRVRRLYPDGNGGVYQLTQNGKLEHIRFDEDGEKDNRKSAVLSSDSEYIISFAYTENWNFIAISAQGTLWQRSNGEIMEEWKEKGLPKLTMAAAYGTIYLLLTQDGRIISNVKELEMEADVRWVGAGLNSVSWITGDACALHSSVQSCEDACLTGVCAAWTREGNHPSETQWAALKQDGTLYYMAGEKVYYIPNIFAADITKEGVLIADKDGLFVSKSDNGKEFATIRNTPDSDIADLCYESMANTKSIYLLDEMDNLQKVEILK